MVTSLNRRVILSPFALGLLGGVTLLILVLSLVASPETSVPLALSPPFVKEITFKNFTPLVVVFLWANYLLINLFGYAISRPLMRAFRGESIVVRFVSTFFIGYLASLGIIRVVSFLVPYKQIYLPSLLVILVITLLASLEWLRERARTGWRNGPGGVGWYDRLREYGIPLLLLGIAYGLILLSQVTLGWFRFVSHGPYVPQMLNYWWESGIDAFPIVAQHYDEWIFHYFVTMPLAGSIQVVLAWWVTLALIKVSVWAFIYLVLQRMQRGPWFSFAVALFFMIGTSSLLPYKYYVLFDALNALFFVINSRIASIGFVFVLLTCLIHWHDRKSQPTLLFFFLTGLGLSATTISNPLWLMLLFTFSLLVASHHFKAGRDALARPAYGWERLILVMALLAMPVLFWLPFQGTVGIWARVAVVGVLLAVTGGWVLVCAFRGMGYFIQLPGGRQMMARLAVFNLAMVLGFLFLGNLFIDNPLAHALHNRLSERVETRSFFPTIQIKPQSADPFASRFLVSFYPNDQVNLLSLVDDQPEELTWRQKVEKWVGDYRILGPELDKMAKGLPAFWHHQVEYERGVTYFFAYFGGWLLLFGVGILLFYARIKTGRLLRSDQMVLVLLVMFLAALPVLLFFVSFIDTSGIIGQPSNKNRFLEIPAYGAIFCSLYAISRFGGMKLKRYAVVWLLAYAVIPFVANDRFVQIAVNMKSLYWTILSTY